jgi:four helix bundle protein
VTKAFPNNESFGMTSQLRRASASVGANIAEGYGREHRGSFIQFLRIAQGSLKEMETHLIICGEVGLLQPTDRERLLDKSDETGKMLRALIRSLQKKG